MAVQLSNWYFRLGVHTDQRTPARPPNTYERKDQQVAENIVPPYARAELHAHQLQQALDAAASTIAGHERAGTDIPPEKHLRVLARAVRAVQDLHAAVPGGMTDAGVCPTCRVPAPCETAQAVAVKR